MTITFQDIIPQLTPDVQVETDWSGAAAGLPVDVKKLLLLGNNLNTGTEPVPTLTDVSTVRAISSEQQAIELYGKGSNLALMVKAALAVSPRIQLYAAPYKVGLAGAAAASAIPFTVVATGNGQLDCYLDGELISVGVVVGDTPTTIVDRLTVAINGLANCGVVASHAVATTLTLTARTVGINGNTIGYKLKMTQGIGSLFQTPAMGAAGVESAGEFFTGGTVDGDPSVQLAAMTGTRYHLIALDQMTVANVTFLKTHVNAVSTPASKKWCMGIVGFNGTAADVQTLGNTEDAYRIQVFWVERCPQRVAIMAAKFAARRAMYGCTESCIDKIVTGLSQPYDPSYALTPAEIETALTEGITPGRCDEYGGTVSIVRSVTTRQTATIAFRDHTIQEKSDYFDEALVQAFGAYKGRTLKTASDPGSPSTFTLGRATGVLNRTIFKLDQLDIVQGTKDAIKAGSNFAEINATDPDRVDVGCIFYPTRITAFIAVQKIYSIGA